MVASSTPSADVASFLTDLTFDQLPDGSVWLAERAFADTIGVVLAGASEIGAGVVAADTLADMTGEDGVASVIGRDFSVDIPEAVFVNSTAGHALDYDDSTPAVPAHLSVSAIPSILAVSERYNLTGEAAITAYVAGFETAYYLSRPVYPNHYQGGWHATGTMGVFCATGAVAKALGLDQQAAEHAINIAASMSSGLRENFGTMTKPMHPGHTSRAGTTAAFLAKNGFTASESALTGDLGYYALYNDGAEPDFSALHTLGEDWATITEGVDIKKYPSCHANHAAIAATKSLVEEHDIGPDDVSEILVIGSPSAKDIMRHAKPTTGLEAKFSMEYAVASAIVHDHVGLHSFRDETVVESTVQSIVDRVTFEKNPELPYKTHRTEVVITDTAGSEYRELVEGPPGTHEEPLSEAELEEKFRLCATQVLDPEVADELFQQLRNFRELDSVATTIT